MFKNEYQGGPFVEVFSGQGRDPISKKCRVTGNATSIHKQYDKDIKSYVYILEGEPTTTKIQLPKDDKQTLFLLQKFVVLQLFVPVGRPFSFELGVSVTDQAQNKRRIFFSSSQKDVTVTSLHAKFPLTVLCLGTWLNLCLDLDSLVCETFNGQTFRALESITVTANCRLRKIFTLKMPPKDTSRNDSANPYSTTEPLPKSLQLAITSDTLTQVLSYQVLAQKPVENQTSCRTTNNTSSSSDASTPRQETHIAFGQKVAIPNHVRKTSLKDCQENNGGKTTRSARLVRSKAKLGHSAPDLRNARTETFKEKSKQQQRVSLDKIDQEKLVNCESAVMQPRPPRTSSAGRLRRTVRVKSNSADVKCLPDELKRTDEKENLRLTNDMAKLDVARRKPDSDEDTLQNSNILQSVETINSRVFLANSVSEEKECVISDRDNEAPSEASTNQMKRSLKVPSDDVVDDENILCGTVDSGVDLNNKTFYDNEENLKSNGSQFSVDHNNNLKELVESGQTERNNCDNALLFDSAFSDNTNSNTSLGNNNNYENETNYERPRKLPLVADNSVFTFSSAPRSPCASKMKFFPSSVTEVKAFQSSEDIPEVKVSLTPEVVDVDKSDSQKKRGALLEDDFCKLSDDEAPEDENCIQKLLQSSLSPRRSPQPSDHQLRQSIRSSLLKEIPSPVNGYDAQNYKSEPQSQDLNQSTASSWRFDLSSSGGSYQDLDDSLNASHGRLDNEIESVNALLGDDDNHSDASDDTFSTWRPPPIQPRGNKYEHEMKNPGIGPDLTATYSIDAGDYSNGTNTDTQKDSVLCKPIMQCDVGSWLFSYQRNLDISQTKKAVPQMAHLRSPGFNKKGRNDSEEELDLLYDPCLNCYFDPKTHKYYELA